MAIDAAAAALIGATIGALAGVASSLVTVVVTEAQESKRHLRDITIKTALDQWTEDRRLAVARNTTHLPFSSYIVQTMKLVDLAQNKRITPEQARIAMDELHAILDVVQKESIEYTHAHEAEHAVDPKMQ